MRVSGLTSVITVSAGSGHSLALTNDGSVWAWGNDFFGQLGNDFPLLNQPTPVPVSGLTGVTVSAGGNHSLVLTNDGKVWAWGNDQSGQLGNNAPLQSQAAPVPVDTTNLR